MRKGMTRFAPAAAAALMLVACGDTEDEAEIADANLALPAEDISATDGPAAVVIYPVGTAASLEMNAIRAEVERLQRESGGSARQLPSQPDDQTDGEESRATGNFSADGGTAGFTASDRDNDGRLSPAEYAIYALSEETPARQGAVNDESAPFVSDEALNEVATEFRRRDANGDFFLSPDEFSPNN